MKILHIEDTDVFLEFGEELFKSFDFVSEYVSAANGTEGYNLAKSGNFDVIITDGQLPGMSGKQIITKLRSEGYKGPIIANSAGYNADLMKAGADFQMEKDFTDEEGWKEVLMKAKNKVKSNPEKKKLFMKKRHIHQKTSADCALASMAMFYNLPWETIKDLYTTEVLNYKARLNMDQNNPNYFDVLFELAFPKKEEAHLIEDAVSGLCNTDMYYLNTVIGGKKNFIEVPYLIVGAPCLITTFIWKDDNLNGHAMYFDGYYIYNPARPLSNYEKEAPEKVTEDELRIIPPFGDCTYLFNDKSLIPKHIAAINKLIGHNDPSKKIPFRIVVPKDLENFSPDNYNIIYTSSIEEINKIFRDEYKFPSMTFEQYLKKFPELASPYFNSNQADEDFIPYEEFKQKATEYFNKKDEEEKKRKIKNNPEGIKVTYLPPEIYIRKYKRKPNPITSKRTNEKLWEKCKKEAVKKMGGHSARAMQYAVKLYKDRGGKYLGKKRPDNDLATWSRAKWQYAPGSKSKDRYLPKEAWEELGPEEEKATRTRKKGKLGEWVKNTKKASLAAKKATARARLKK